jgi:hypothetical protein
MSYFANSCGLVLSFLAFVACNATSFKGTTASQKPILSKEVPPAASNSTTKTASPESEKADPAKDVAPSANAEPAKDVAPSANAEPAKDVMDCEKKALSTAVLQLDFPATKGTCTWDIGIHLGGMYGHLEQTLKLPVQNNWVVCGISLAANKPDLYYDDYISLQFNNRTLIGSPGLVDILEKDEQGLPIFDWTKLQRQSISSGNTCLPGAVQCTLPESQRAGALQLELDAATQQKLMLHAAKEGRYEFSVLTTGDNEIQEDCAHNGIPLSVTVKYYTR